MNSVFFALSEILLRSALTLLMRDSSDFFKVKKLRS